MASRCGLFRDVLLRRRVYQPQELEVTNLRRCLGRWDLVGLGCGSALVVGLFAVLGPVTGSVAGPAIVLSFLIAAIGALFAALCYAEWAGRVPRAGAAYAYTYAALGEFLAFLVGWNVVLEALFGAASVARGLSSLADMLSGGALSGWLQAALPTAAPLHSYFDLLAFLVVLALGVVAGVGVRQSTAVNNVLVAVSAVMVAFVVVAGAFKATASNWNLSAEDVPPDKGSGGFFPYGVCGVLQGAAVCFYAFTGFDTICYAAEEAREPRRHIPTAILTVLGVVLLAYLGVAVVTTMMVPYFLQGISLSLPLLFEAVGWPWAQWVVAAGACCTVLSGVVCALFPIPRLMAAMAEDGLLPRPLVQVAPNKVPVLGTVLAVAIIAVLAGLLPLAELVLLTCVGTALSFTAVAAALVVVRYRSENPVDASPGWWRQLLGCGVKSPSRTSATVVRVTLALFMGVCFCAALVYRLADNSLVLVVILHVAALVLLLVIALQPQVTEELHFKTPLVPFIPCLSIYININLMVLIGGQTWIRIAAWILIGIPLYIICTCCYKRKENKYLKSNINSFLKAENNGKPSVQIIVESPTPPDTIKQISRNDTIRYFPDIIPMNLMEKREEIIIQHAIIDNNEEKEAKIIDLLDQVLQAEEDTYGEITSMQDQKDDEVIVSTAPEIIPHRKSLSELSDAGSDASLGSQVLSKYDVIAQVHREDLPKVDEDEEKNEKDELYKENIEEHEQVTAFNNSDTNSRTDESGYSDTIDNNFPSNDFTENSKEDVPYIPEPPPLDENFFENSIPRPSNSLSKENKEMASSSEDIPYIPEPPPLDENFFANSNFKKSYTISIPRPTKPSTMEQEETKPRESVQSNGSYDDGHMVFGSDKQMNFMSKLNNIFQNKMYSANEECGGEKMKRSHSAGNVVENTVFDVYRERPPEFLDLHKELLSKSSQQLRTVNVDENKDSDEDDSSMSREDLKTKLESIFASGGPSPLKPRLMKSNPPTPEESYNTDTSSIESIPKLPKMDKNDTLKRQKAKFGEVLNSFRLNLSKDDVV